MLHGGLSSRVSESLHVPKHTIAQGYRLSCRNSLTFMKTNFNELSSNRGVGH
jgi:hypothetical protein